MPSFLALLARLSEMPEPGSTTTPVGKVSINGDHLGSDPSQFGAGFTHIRQFRAKFRDTLALALAAYQTCTYSRKRSQGII